MRFVVLGDLHYSRYRDPAICKLREEFFDRIFGSVANLSPDLVLAIGDTTDNGYRDEFEGLHACARRNRVNFVTVNGNHDLLELDRPTVSAYTQNYTPYFVHFFNPVSGRSHPADPEAARFVVLDTPRERSPKDHSGYVAPEQLDWLESQVLESAANPLFVFGHHPLRSTTLWSSFRMLSIENSKQVGQIFSRKRQGAAFYFCGHNHAHSIARRNNWHFIQTAAPLRSSDLRVIDYTSGQVSLHTIELEGGSATYAMGQKLAAALGDFSRMPARGFSRDRRLQVQLTGQPVLDPALEAYRQPENVGAA
jgi:3',5'-cyclic AMP phosphodiesterase CpdA